MRYFKAIIETNNFIKIERNQVFGLNEETNKIYYDTDKFLPNFIKLDLSNVAYFSEINQGTLFSIGSEVIYYDKLCTIKGISYFKMQYIIVEISSKKEYHIPFEIANLLKIVRYYWFISSTGKIMKDKIKEYDNVAEYRKKVGNYFYSKEDAQKCEIKVIKK